MRRSLSKNHLTSISLKKPPTKARSIESVGDIESLPKKFTWFK